MASFYICASIIAYLVIFIGGYYWGNIPDIRGLVRFFPCLPFCIEIYPETLPISSFAPNELLRLSLPVLRLLLLGWKYVDALWRYMLYCWFAEPGPWALRGFPSGPVLELEALATESPVNFPRSFYFGGVECPLRFATEKGGDIMGVIVMYFWSMLGLWTEDIETGAALWPEVPPYLE
jgi:hypothetical protein